MKLPLPIAQRLLNLTISHSPVPASTLQGSAVQKMIEDGVIQKIQTGRTKAALFIKDTDAFKAYLLNHFGISDLVIYVEKLSAEELTRAEAIEISGNSKLKSVRTFKGFLVNAYSPVQATLNSAAFIIHPSHGSYTFISDYEAFVLDKSITVVGIENAENFRYVEQQQYLFKDIQPLFVSRYPQSNDLINWLKSIPNQYVHFGDLDFAGIGIFLNEYKKHLGEKAKLFIPKETEQFLDKFGNRELYNQQLHLLSSLKPNGNDIENLIKLLHSYKKVLEQEIFIQFDEG